MDRTTLPGYRPILPTEYGNFSLEARIRAAAINPEGGIDQIEPEKLGQAPLFEFKRSDGDGAFESHPPPDHHPIAEIDGIPIDRIKNPQDIASRERKRPIYEKGKGPDAAPMTQEQMRLLLFSVIPPRLMPFVMDRMVFLYETDEKKLDKAAKIHIGKHTGADGVERNKIYLTFNRSAFLTKRTPPEELAKPPRLRRSEVTGYIDPSRIAHIIGRVFGKMIDAPDDWQKRVPKHFRLTLPRTERQRKLADVKRQDQWEEFVGLCITSPEYAKRFSPKAYEYFTKAIERMTDASGHELCINKIEGLSPDEKEIDDFQLNIDLRTEEEKNKVKDKDDPANYDPELYWFDYAFTGANRLLKLVGLRLTYELPDDPDRAFQASNDAAEVKKLLERTRQADRDRMFGKLMRLARFDNIEDKARARQFLMASAQSEDWAEWREIVYLHKFSPVFRKSGGRKISKDDFEDLRTVHNMSSAQGHRHGTDMMPWEMVPVPDPADVSGRTMVIEYRRKDDAQWFREVEHKINERGDRGFQSVGLSVFDLFYHSDSKDPHGLIDPNRLEAIYDHTAAGMDNTYGRLDVLLGDSLAHELVSKYLQPLKVRQIPPDALIILRRFYQLTNGGKGKDGKGNLGEHVPRAIVPLMPHFGSRLIVPPIEEVHHFTHVADHLKADSPPDQVAHVVAQGEELKHFFAEAILSIADPPEEVAGHHEPVTVGDGNRIYLRDVKSRETLKRLLEQGHASIPAILTAFQDDVERQRREVHEPRVQAMSNDQERDTYWDKVKLQVVQERANLIAFLSQKQVQDNLNLYREVVEHEKRIIKPKTLDLVEKGATELETNPSALLGTTSHLDPTDLAVLDKTGISNKESRNEAIQEALEVTVKEKAAELAERKKTKPEYLEEKTQQIEAKLREVASKDFAIEQRYDSIFTLPYAEREKLDHEREEWYSETSERGKAVAEIGQMVAKTREDSKPKRSNPDNEQEVRGVLKTIVERMCDAQVGVVRRQLAESDEATREKLLIAFFERAIKPQDGKDENIHSLQHYLSQEDLGTLSERYEAWLRGPGKVFSLRATKHIQDKIQYAANLMGNVWTMEQAIKIQGEATKNILDALSYAKEEIQREEAKKAEAAKAT